MSIDNNWALIGSTNWDARSLRLNFEYDIEVYDPIFVSMLSQHIQDIIERSHKVTQEQVQERSPFRKIIDSGLRLFQPYL